MFLGEVLSVFHFFLWPLASCIVLDCLLGSLLVINSYLSKKKKKTKDSTNPNLRCITLYFEDFVEIR